MTEYRKVCPHCSDDHSPADQCKVEDLKVQIDGLRLQLELVELHEEQRLVRRHDFNTEICKAQSRSDDQMAGSKA
jgi:hypothetical protein